MVIGEWQWEKFRAFDFLGRFERGRGWEVMGVGEREGVRERARAHDVISLPQASCLQKSQHLPAGPS